MGSRPSTRLPDLPEASGFPEAALRPVVPKTEERIRAFEAGARALSAVREPA